MDHFKAFLDDIRECPDDDGVRLILSDWLEENGEEERAEFIRLQLRTEQTDVYDAGYPEQVTREKELQTRHEKAWLGRLRKHVTSHVFRRGLLDEVSMRVEVLLKHGPKLFAEHPIRVLRLRFEPGDRDRARQIARCRALDTVETLDLSGNRELTAEVIRELSCSPHLARLTRLNLSGCAPAEDVIDALVAGEVASRLEKLDLSSNELSINSVERLVTSMRLENLEALSLSQCRLGTASCEMLASSKRLAMLRALDLTHNRLDAASARALAGCPRLAELRWLNLANNNIGGEGAAALGRSPHLRRLERLQLLSNGVGSSGVAELSKGGFLDHMQFLELSGNRVGEAGVRALVGSSPRGLIHLHFGTDEITDESMKMLARWPALATIRDLNLYSNQITAFGMRALIDSPHCRSLCRMNLEANRLGDLGAQVLAVWPGLARMRWLKLRANEIGDEGAMALARSPHLELLTDLDLSDNPCSEDEQQSAFDDPDVRRRVLKLAPWDKDVAQISHYPPFTAERPRG